MWRNCRGELVGQGVLLTQGRMGLSWRGERCYRAVEEKERTQCRLWYGLAQGFNTMEEVWVSWDGGSSKMRRRGVFSCVGERKEKKIDWDYCRLSKSY